jgi:hypothetical protein
MKVKALLAVVVTGSMISGHAMAAYETISNQQMGAIVAQEKTITETLNLVLTSIQPALTNGEFQQTAVQLNDLALQEQQLYGIMQGASVASTILEDQNALYLQTTQLASVAKYIAANPAQAKDLYIGLEGTENLMASSLAKVSTDLKNFANAPQQLKEQRGLLTQIITVTEAAAN